MKKKLVVLAMSLGLSLAMLTGCGAPTVEELVDSMYENQPESATMDITMDMGLEMAMEGISAEIELGADFTAACQGLQNPEELVMEMTGTVDMDAMGTSESVDMEAYYVADGEEVTMYLYDEASDMWTYSESEMDLSASMEANDSVKELWYNATLAEETEEKNGVECYVLTMDLNMADMADVMNEAMDAAEMEEMFESLGVSVDMEEMYEYINMKYTVYVSVEEQMLIAADVDASAIDLLGICDALGLSDYIGEIETLEFTTFTVGVVMSDINETTVEVPEDVIDEAVEAGDITTTVVPEGETGEEPSEDSEEPSEEPSDDEEVSSDATSVDLYDLAGNFLITVNIPEGFTYLPEWSDTTDWSYINMESSEEDIWVNSYVTYEMQYFLNDGTTPDDEGISNYNVTVTDLEPVAGGVQCFVACETFTYTFDDGTSYDSENYYICVPYTDPYDSNLYDFVNIELDYNAADWTVDQFQQRAYEVFGE